MESEFDTFSQKEFWKVFSSVMENYTVGKSNEALMSLSDIHPSSIPVASLYNAHAERISRMHIVACMKLKVAPEINNNYWNLFFSAYLHLRKSQNRLSREEIQKILERTPKEGEKGSIYGKVSESLERDKP